MTDGFDADVSELNSLAITLVLGGGRVRRQGQQLVERAAMDTVAGGQAFAPVDTGNLRNSIGADIDPDGLGFVAGPTADYGDHVEFGTVHMAPQAFMGPAFDRVIPDAVKGAEELGGRVLG